MYSTAGVVVHLQQASERDRARRRLLADPRINPGHRHPPPPNVAATKQINSIRQQPAPLFRTTNLREADERFDIFKFTIPPLVEIASELCNVSDMQRICDTMIEHKGWTVGHLAAFMAVSENALTNALVVSCLQELEPDTGRTPLHVALHTGNKQVVQTLVAQGALLLARDFSGNNVYHYAATTSRELVEYLQTVLTDHSELLDERNKEGFTPLHLACLEDKPPCVEALLLAGANASIAARGDGPNEPPQKKMQSGLVAEYLSRNPNKLIATDMKYGGTPLHWAGSREVIETLADMGCCINTINFSQRTPLHVMVSKGKQDCVVALLSCGASVELTDLQGDTALHLAAREKSLSVIQALLVFQAPLQALNNKGCTPRHEVAQCEDENRDHRLWALHAVGAERCPPGTVGCKEGCIAGIGVKLLSLDGGGIRGLVLIQILLAIERALGGVPLMHCFDLLAGTSTGGILALGLATGKSLAECQCIYFRLKDQVFKGKRPYNSEPLEKLLQNLFGEQTVMNDIPHPRLLITGLLADRKPPELHLFRNYKCALDVLTNAEPLVLPGTSSADFHQPPSPKSQRLWEAARASGAAPSYFRAFGPFLDGGLVANNPAMDAMTELHELNLALKAVGREDEVKPLGVVVSVGTGEPPLSKLTEIDVFRPDSLFDTMRLARGLSALGTLLATLAGGRVVDRTRSWCSSLGVPYYRFSPYLSEDVEMDEKDDAKLVNMLWETRAYMHKHSMELATLASLLLKDR
ncbi:hypothetical protein B566_EDAN010053 [Ephemera danica]|nr:hypothetical protein B566_EDAN010053 [Ephemera danica]